MQPAHLTSRQPDPSVTRRVEDDVIRKAGAHPYMTPCLFVISKIIQPVLMKKAKAMFRTGHTPEAIMDTVLPERKTDLQMVNGQRIYIAR